jgi:phage-related protein
MGNKQEITAILSVVENNFFKTIKEVEATVNQATQTTNQLYEALQKLSGNSVNVQSFDDFKLGAQEASNLIDRLGEKLKNQFALVVQAPNLSDAVTTVDSAIKGINDKLKQLHLPSLGEMFAGETSIFAQINSKVDATTQSFGNLVQGFDDKRKKMAGSIANWKKNLSDFSQNTQYQMKLAGMHIRSQHPAVAALGAKFSTMSSLVGSSLANVGAKFSGFGSQITGMVNNSVVLSTAFSGIGKSLKTSTDVGKTALSTMVQGLTSVFGFALKALGPAAILGVALAGFGLLDSEFGGQISSMIETATTKGPELISGFIEGIVTKLPELITTGAQLVSGLAEAISVNLPFIMQGAIDLLNALVQGVIENLPTLIPAALQIIESLATSLLTAAPQLLMTGLDLLLALVNGIIENKDQIISTVKNILETFTTQITENLPEIIQKGIEILTKLAEGIASVLPELIPIALEAITTLVRTLSENLPKLLDAAVEIVGKLCEGLLANLPQILSAAVGLILALVQGIGESIPKICAAGAKIMLKLLETVIKAVPDLKDAGMNLIKGLIDGITGMGKAALDAVKGLGKSIGDTFKSIFKIHSPSRWMRDEVGAMLPAGLAIGIERNVHVVDQPMDKLASQIMLPSLDSLDQHMDTIQEVSVQSSSKLQMVQSKQPATFNIRLGNQQFKAFVADISEAMGQDAAINLAF